MRVFDETKTFELNEYDLEKGFLKEDKLFVAHHPKLTPVEEVGHYETIAEYPNGGKDVKWVVDIPGCSEEADEWDEYEDILVFIPYTEEQLEEKRLAKLRSTRKSLLAAFDKWEKAVLRGREFDDPLIMSWYQGLLDLNEYYFNNIPDRIQYYL